MLLQWVNQPAVGTGTNKALRGVSLLLGSVCLAAESVDTP